MAKRKKRKNGTFGFNVDAVMKRLRDALGKTNRRLSTDAARALSTTAFIEKVERAGVGEDPESEASRILEALGDLLRAKEESETPLARLVAMREDVLKAIAPLAPVLDEYERSQAAVYAQHVSNSRSPARERRDVQAHHATTKQAAHERRSELALPDTAVCIDPLKHELLCVWPIRLRMALQEIEEGFEAMDGIDFFRSPELLPSSTRVRQSLFSDLAHTLYGKKEPHMAWARCAQLLVDDTSSPKKLKDAANAVRKAAARFYKDRKADDLDLWRMRDSVLRDSPENIERRKDPKWVAATKWLTDYEEFVKYLYHKPE